MTRPKPSELIRPSTDSKSRKQNKLCDSLSSPTLISQTSETARPIVSEFRSDTTALQRSDKKPCILIVAYTCSTRIKISNTVCRSIPSVMKPFDMRVSLFVMKLYTILVRSGFPSNSFLNLIFFFDSIIKPKKITNEKSNSTSPFSVGLGSG